jgi:hypothetical protein
LSVGQFIQGTLEAGANEDENGDTRLKGKRVDGDLEKKNTMNTQNDYAVEAEKKGSE